MTKTILITGATDGIGLATATQLVEQGHNVILHGRNAQKLERTLSQLSALGKGGEIDSFVADLSLLPEAHNLAKAVASKYSRIDVLINNAGVFKVPDAISSEGRDVRFVVNTIAPYALTIALLPLLGVEGRVVNLSSAAQAPVELAALKGDMLLTDDFSVYAQSKLALTMWSRHLALSLGDNAPVIVAVNPGSLLGTKMVKQGFNTTGNDISIGSDILVKAALSDEFAVATGLYFDNDKGRFDMPHIDGLDQNKCKQVVDTIDAVLAELA